MKALPLILAVLGVGVVACLLVGWSLLRLGAAASAPVPTSVEVREFEGDLQGRWRAAQGGFTGDEVETPLDADLSAQWPNGSALELSLLDDGRYQLTVVDSTGSGPSLDRVLHREQGRWTFADGSLSLKVESGTEVRRRHGERTSAEVQVQERTFSVKARVSEVAGPPGASPSVSEALQLGGACVIGAGQCEWVLSAD